MRARATLVHQHATPGTDLQTHLLVSLSGEVTADRPRLGVIPVLDRSGSMAADGKLATAAAALSHLSGHLTADDQLALVSFADSASLDLPTTSADAHGAAGLRSALARTFPSGGTSLVSGLSLALQQAHPLDGDRLVRVIVITDGRSSHAERPAQLHALLAEAPPHVSVSFLGVGSDCDHTLLASLAAATGGSYGFIESAVRAPEVLGAEMGAVLGADAHQLMIHIRPRARFLSVARPLGIRRAHLAADGTLRIPLGVVQSGAARHVVVPVTLHSPRRGHIRPVTVADVQVTGHLARSRAQVTLLPKAHFASEGTTAATLPRDPGQERELAEILELAVLAQAQLEAEERATAGDFGGAWHVLSSLQVSTGAAAGLQATLAGTYRDAQTYHAAATTRSSTTHALSGTLAGSGESFDALWARTVGHAYTTGRQRQLAADTRSATQQPTLEAGEGGADA